MYPDSLQAVRAGRKPPGAPETPAASDFQMNRLTSAFCAVGRKNVAGARQKVRTLRQ